MSDAIVPVRVRSLVFAAGAMLMGAVMAAVLLSALRVDAAPGDVDTTMVPITACRLVDTRPDNQVGPRNAPLGAEQTYTVNVQDASTECAGKVPVEASGLVLNVTATRTSQRTFVTVWDSGPWPGTSSMNPAPGPPVPNAVTTKLSGSNTFEVYNNAGSTHLIVDIVAFLTPSSLTDLDSRLLAFETAGVSENVLDRIEGLESKNAALESKVSALETKTASMSIVTVDGERTLRVSGVNVQIVDGTGDTRCGISGFEPCTGVGNLVVGYNEDGSAAGDAQRSGSHNIVGGVDNSYTSYSGFVGGYANTVSADFAMVSSGSFNVASGVRSAVLSGQGSTASGFESSVVGGIKNAAGGEYAAVLGGDRNTASGDESTVAGGGSNTASGGESAVAGGNWNEATMGNTSVTGGRYNIASGDWSTIAGGNDNEATGPYATVLGGEANTASGRESTVSGGGFNTASGEQATVSGGYANDANGSNASVSGGRLNVAEEGDSSVSGGSNNRAASIASSVSGGSDNTTSANFSSITGGRNNQTAARWSTIVGGGGPLASLDGNFTALGAEYSTVTGGDDNTTFGVASTVSGGVNNTARGVGSSVSGGGSRGVDGTFDWRGGGLTQDS